VLDSIRSLKDSKLQEIVNKITSAIKTLWQENYATSPVKLEKFEGPFNVRPPKQQNKLVQQTLNNPSSYFYAIPFPSNFFMFFFSILFYVHGLLSCILIFTMLHTEF
jgi:hypothetical protein